MDTIAFSMNFDAVDLASVTHTDLRMQPHGSLFCYTAIYSAKRAKHSVLMLAITWKYHVAFNDQTRVNTTSILVLQKANLEFSCEAYFCKIQYEYSVDY